jgi:hypothetical protein
VSSAETIGLGFAEVVIDDKRQSQPCLPYLDVETISECDADIECRSDKAFLLRSSAMRAGICEGCDPIPGGTKTLCG